MSTKSQARKFLESIRGKSMTFGEMIASIRQADEWSQVNLAKKLKISRAHLCDIEKGRRSVTIERAKQFAEVLGYSIHQFVALAVEDQLRKAGLKVNVEINEAA